MKYLSTFAILFFIFSNLSFSQQDDYQIGSNTSNLLRQNQGAYYDYSDPDGINIKVSVWGYVKYPGRYIIPVKSDIKDLISYSGGVNDNAYLEDLRIYRLNRDSTQVLLKFNYEDLWWNDSLTSPLDLSQLHPGDVLVVPGRRRLYWENYLSLSLSALGLLVSIATLIITANR